MQLELVGMYDSPYVRRVAITLHQCGLPYQHHNWSVFRDAERVRELNPLGRVPILRIDGGEPLIDSAAILDFIDEATDAERCLLPPSGEERRAELRRIAVATGATDKAVGMVYERYKRDRQFFDPAWFERMQVQLGAALEWMADEIESPGGEPASQSQITAAVAVRFVQGHFPDLADAVIPDAQIEFSRRCESLPSFLAAPYPED